MAQLIYTTTGSLQEARTIASAIVREKLAACTNIIPKIESIYRWHGKIEGATETLLIAKTTDDKAAACIDRIRSLHPYELPDIITLPITGGLPDYLTYLSAETT